MTFLARILSIAGHPFLLVPLGIAVSARSWQAAAFIAATTSLPLLIVTVRNVRRGTWSDFDVSRRDQRGGLHTAIAAVLVLTAIALYATGASPRMLRGVAAAAAMFALAVLGKRWMQISLHMIGGVYAATLVIAELPWSALALVPFLAAVAWSRVHLGRHTLAEVLAGAAIGAAGGIATIL